MVNFLLGVFKMAPKSHGCHCTRRKKSNKTKTNSLLLAVTVVLCFSNISSAEKQIETNDIESYLNSLSEKSNIDKSKVPSLPVNVGIADTTAIVGRLFTYTIPEEAFQVKADHYKIVEAGKDQLPAWLSFDQKTSTLKGIPAPEDLDQVYIHVTAFDKMDSGIAKDVFSISVVEDMPHSAATTAFPLSQSQKDTTKTSKCLKGSAVTMVTVIIDADIHKLKADDRLGLLSSMTDHLKVEPGLLKLLPMGNRPMFDSSALVAGPGDVKQPKNPGAIFQWEVGCGTVESYHMPILQKVESSSADGSMAQAVGHGIIGWHVTNNRAQTGRRIKRQVAIQPTQTQQATMGPPTHLPGVTLVVEETTETMTTDHQMTRKVPTMESPAFPVQVQPTKTHHHRTKTRGRHHHKTKHTHIKHSPTRKHDKTKQAKTVMPTATVLPIQPTRVTDRTPTMVIDASMGRVTPTEDMASPGVSRTADFIEPSMPAKGTVAIQPTQVLPTRTYTVDKDMATTEAVKPSKTEAATMPTKQPPITKSTPATSTEPFNFAPRLMNQIDRLTAMVGDVVEFKIPDDTFYDLEDGNTRNLKLMFMTHDKLLVAPNSWIKLDVKNQRLYGLPLPRDEGKHDYILAAIDSGARIRTDAFEFIVKPRPPGAITHEISLILEMNYRKFIADVDERIRLAWKIAKLYGDYDANKITVTKLSPGSVVFSWTNNTLPPEPCPSRAIQHLLTYIIKENETNIVTDQLIKALAPTKIIKANVRPLGSCVERMGTVSASPAKPTVVETQRETSDEDILITTVVPAVVIAAMLLLAACIACVLYRKKRKGKLSDEDQHTFVNRGIPIIFADELDDKPDPSKKPLIMEEEKPPLPPPEYQKYGSVPSTPPSDHKEALDTSDDDEDVDDIMSPPYHPPPPFTGSQGNRQPRRPMQPTYRNPPPYVPP